MLVVAIVIAIIIAVAIEMEIEIELEVESASVAASFGYQVRWGTFMLAAAAAEDTLPVIKVTNRSHKTKLSLSGASRALHGQRP